MKDMARLLEKWHMNVGDVREQMYRAPTLREAASSFGLARIIPNPCESCSGCIGWLPLRRSL